MDVGAVASVITNAWYLAALVRWCTRKGTYVNARCKSLMCEVRSLMWPCYAIKTFVYQMDWMAKTEHSWWESPPSHYFFMVLDFACVCFYWRMFKDDEDDDRWQRRRKRISKTIRARLTIPHPASQN